jgi:NADH:ubiquinone oxidoreductase subunit 5 (subunit L)/multisubunit Na+/H+ antiporter MnhA subunit
METKFFTYLFGYFIISSLVRFVLVILLSTFSQQESAEKGVYLIARYGSLLDLAQLALAFVLFGQKISFYLKDFLYTGLTFDVYWDAKSLIFLSFSIIIISLINHFSTVYLSRDLFYFKFFSMIYLLQLALTMLILTRGNETILMGWEFMGLSSVLLIAFYEYRSSVLKNSLIILAIYKTSDLLLYGSLLYSTTDNAYCLIALLLACLIKSSVIPWFWLPKAVEGPTQSTAVFYGGLATHIPVYLFIRAWESHSITEHPILLSGVICLIVISILTTHILSKTVNDAKNSIAYATITHLGIIYLEVLFGLTSIAIFHCLMHGLYRTMEFLRSPSILYDHQMQPRSQYHLPNLLPATLRDRIYHLAYNEFIFSRIFMHVVESFMGIFSSRMNSSVIKSYLICSSLLLFSAECIAWFSIHKELMYTDQLLLLLAYAFNLLALLNKYRPINFITFLSTSVLVSLSILSEKIHPMTLWYALAGVVVIISIFALTYQFRKRLPPLSNFIGQMYRSNRLNFLLLITGLSIIGMPGLGVFYIWSKLEHALITVYPNHLLLVYVLLTLNTIVFFRFYYVNFLGKHDLMKQIKSAQS